MATIFDTARQEDYEDVIDLGNYVFSQAHMPHNFPLMLPKLFKKEYFMDGIHYLAREEGKIRAVIGAYPLKWEFSDQGLSDVTLCGRGIGMVAVHPYSRSRGYMKELMNRALSDMRRDHMVFTCLTGHRQRYEYFGYGRTGSVYSFTCSETNIWHTLGQDLNTNLSLKIVESGDNALLDRIHAFHEAKPSRLHRQRERLFDILSSWEARILALTEGERFCGYIVYKANGAEQEITEINLTDLSRLPEVIGLFLRNGKAAGMKPFVQVSVCPHETEKLTAFSRFAERYVQSTAYSFAVLDYVRFVEPFIKQKQQGYSLCEGSFVLQVEGGPRFRLAVQKGAASVIETSDPPDLSLSCLDALHFLFSPLASQTVPAVGKSIFLQSLLPLPLFYETPDGI
jgi:predicted N-acetyltransferase YhbS